MRSFNDNHCEVRVQKSVRSAADGGMTCADFGPSEFPRQPICTHLQGKPLNVVFYLDMSRNIRGYQLSFYAQMITSVLRHFAAVHISNKGENKITIKKYNKRSKFYYICKLNSKLSAIYGHWQANLDKWKRANCYVSTKRYRGITRYLPTWFTGTTRNGINQ